MWQLNVEFYIDGLLPLSILYSLRQTTLFTNNPKQWRKSRYKWNIPCVVCLRKQLPVYNANPATQQLILIKIPRVCPWLINTTFHCLCSPFPFFLLELTYIAVGIEQHLEWQSLKLLCSYFDKIRFILTKVIDIKRVKQMLYNISSFYVYFKRQNARKN